MKNLHVIRRAITQVVLVIAAAMSMSAMAADTETINGQVVRQKDVDDGGSGRYRAIVVSEKTLPHFTIYRPRNVKYAARREGPVPILIWFNGGCSGTSTGYEHMLNEIASHGYVVVGIGAFRMVDSDGGDDGSDWQQAGEAINWLVKQERTKSSDYYRAINLKNIALAGHSCGGAQAIANCGNSRVKTLLIMNSGMGGMSMGGASPETLNSLHCPIIYMTGGPDDVAYWNAQTDFGRVKKPVVWADLSNAGHYGSTYWEKYGGEYGRIAVKWMDWHLKGYRQNARIFLKPDLKGFSSFWKLQTRNFTAKDMDYDAPFQGVETVTETAFDRAACDSVFDFGVDISSLTIEKNLGKAYYNQEGRKKDVLPILREQGINSARVRMLVNPSNGYFNLGYARTLSTLAKSQRFNIMLDLHYCDWWGDYVKPNAWKTHSMEDLLTDVAKHTTNAVRAFNTTGRLRWVQIGNEVDNGMLWEEGRETPNFVNFINTAYDAVKAVNPEVQTVIHVSECVDIQWLTDYFDTLQVAGAKWDAIGLSVHVKASNLKPDSLINKVVQNIAILKERYGKPVLVAETGYYNDRALEANQWLCDFLWKLMDVGASGLYYWEPELADDYDLGAWNPLTRRPSIALDAFLGLRHREGVEDAVRQVQTDSPGNFTEYYSPSGVRLSRPARGLNIVRKFSKGKVETYKVYK